MAGRVQLVRASADSAPAAESDKRGADQPAAPASGRRPSPVDTAESSEQPRQVGIGSAGAEVKQVRNSLVPTVPTGATLLDLGLAGGWGIGRVGNIVGDTSSGKTLLAIEAAANFARLYGIRDIRYNEAENAFSRSYAEAIGLPLGLKFTGDDAEKEVDRRGSRTVEEFEEDFARWIKSRVGKGRPCMYILDSFDALEAGSELKREFGDRQPGAKAALASEFYRTHIADIDAARCLLLIISQLREAIGVMFGETKVRSGGRAHDFFASQIVWLATSKQIRDRVAGVERTVGARSIFNVKKNKIGAPFARAPLLIYFHYGVDDELSNLAWLEETKLGAAGRLTIPIGEYASAITDVRKARDFDTLRKMREELRAAVEVRWREIEAASAPPLRKYGDMK